MDTWNFFSRTALIVVIMVPIFQPVEYHQLVSRRIYFGMPNFFSVVFNAFLLFVGVAGLVFLPRPRELLIHWMFIELPERALFYFILKRGNGMSCFSTII